MLWTLVLREIAHRRLGFAAGVFSVVVAVGCVAGVPALLAAHDARTERLIEDKEIETREAMTGLENDYRRIMRDMGYNVLVLHQDQDIAAFHSQGHPDVFMPETYAQQLAEGGITTLNHLLPVLQHRLLWEEEGIDLMVAGIIGQIPIVSDKRSGAVGPDGTPIMEPVPRGMVNIGHAVAERMNLEQGSELHLRSTTLTVNRVHPPRGGADDMTLWVHLELAQEWFDRPGQINGILALECVCETDALGRITREVTRILPDTQVFEFSSMVRTRALARGRAASAHADALNAERRNRAALRAEREQLARTLPVLILSGAAVWIFLLTFFNVRERRTEIGILRALGFGAPKILSVFMFRAALMGFVGAVPGHILGVWVGWTAGNPPDPATLPPLLSAPGHVLLSIMAATALACLAAWLPALSAAVQDPAATLREV